jgi:glycopeptide antibiotics resistance protein
MWDAGAGKPRQSGLEWSLFAYSSIITLLITLAPFRFYWPPSVRVIYVGPVFDIVSNILLFLPPGFLYSLTHRPRAHTHGARVFWLGFALSCGIEIIQIFQPGRYPSPADVLANAAGAWLGARLCERGSRLRGVDLLAAALADTTASHSIEPADRFLYAGRQGSR